MMCTNFKIECDMMKNYPMKFVPIFKKLSIWSPLVWNDFPITLFRESLNGICFDTSFIILYLAYISNLRPLKTKLSVLQAFGFFWQLLAIFAFLAELDNSKHFEPYLFFWPLRPFLALQPLWPSKAKKSGLFRHN